MKSIRTFWKNKLFSLFKNSLIHSSEEIFAVNVRREGAWAKVVLQVKNIASCLSMVMDNVFVPKMELPEAFTGP